MSVCACSSQSQETQLEACMENVIVCLPFSISPISEGHRGTENQDYLMDTSINPYYSQKECVFGCYQDNSLPSFNTVVQ